MRKITPLRILSIALLFIVLIGCTPALPARTAANTTNATPVMNETAAPAMNETAAPSMNETMQEKTPEVSLKDVPKKEVTEGETVSFPNLKAVDPDGDLIKYTFSEPLSEKGTWKTKEGDAGDHLVTITASDGTNTVSQQIIIVVQPKNKPPTISLSEPIEAIEGETFSLTPTISDVEGDEVKLTYSGWMTSDSKHIAFNDSGLHKVFITASDGHGASTKEVIISVQNKNRAPVFSSIPSVDIKEGEKMLVKPVAKDPDGDTVKFVFDEPLDQSGSWQTKVGDAGDYEILVTATDGDLTTESTFNVTVEAVNRPPVIELASPVEVNEGDTVVLKPTITDKEGDKVEVSYVGWMTSDTKTTGYDDSGNHKVIITARDSAGNKAELEVIVTVKDLNRAPIFGAGSFN